MRGEPSDAAVRPDRTVSVLGYGRLRELAERLASIEGVRSFSQPAESERPTTGGSVSVERRSAADGGVVTEPVDRAVEHAPVSLVATDLATAGSAPAQALERIADTETTGIAVVAFPIEGEPAGPRPHEQLEGIREAADATVVLRGDNREADLRAIATALVDVMSTAGYVNLDLADVRTVLAAGPYAIITTGTADMGADDPAGAVEAVEAAIDDEPAPAAATLIYLVGPPDMTLADGMAAVETLKTATGGSPTVIWGVAIDTDRASVSAHIVSGIDDPDWLADDLDAASRLTPGDPCPRCGGRVVAYSFGDSETQACDDCGFVGIDASR